MANKGRTQIQKIARWKVLETRLSDRLAEVPELAAEHAELQRIIAEAEALEAKAELHRAGAQAVTVKRKEIATAGEAVRSHMVLALQYKLGPANKQLMEFGIRPRAAGPRKKKDELPAAPGPGNNGQGPPTAQSEVPVPAEEAPGARTVPEAP